MSKRRLEIASELLEPAKRSRCENPPVESGEENAENDDAENENAENDDAENENAENDDEEDNSLASPSSGSEEEYVDIEEDLLEKDPDAYKILMDVRDEIRRTEPNLVQILRDPMRLKDRAKIVQLWEIYNTCDPDTEERLDARNTVQRALKDAKTTYHQYMQYTSEEHSEMDNQIKDLTGYDAQLSLKYKILKLEASKDVKEAIYRKFEEFADMRSRDDEYGKLKNWLTWAVDVPHNRLKTLDYSNLTEFLRNVARKLDQELYGMDNVKEQLLIFLNAKIHNPTMKKCSLGLLGPPGSGKTALARLLAEVMDFPFEQISCGGVNGPEFFRGHDFAYVGSGPGEIVKCLKRMGYKNGVLYLDEYEKVSENEATCAALLGITDPSQNHVYQDLYLSGLPMDLSHIWFIKSMNALPNDSALRDRIFVVNVPGYSFTDKIEIVKNYLTPKACKNAGLAKNDIIFGAGAANHLVSKVCQCGDKGVRTIEKSITDIVNKIHFLVQHQDEDGVIKGFKISFDPKQKLTYPLSVSNELIDQFVESKETNSYLHSMYM
jgi:ATP-dependent Lon protease